MKKKNTKLHQSTILSSVLVSALFALTMSSTKIAKDPVKLEDPVLFVSRQIPCCGSSYMPTANALPGTGGFSKFQVAAPSYLCILQPNGTIDTLINGANPTVESLYLIDISAPCLSYDAQQVVFAGLPDGEYELGNNQMVDHEHNAWRIYSIQIDGTGLQQITGLSGIPGSDQDLDLSQFSPLAYGLLAGYDDTDPAWLPDGRIVFSSTRFPGLSMYNETRTSNLYVVNQDGTELHRITSEKNGADEPEVDPLTGQIVFSRWWRNFYWPYDGLESVPHNLYTQGWKYKDGLTSSIFEVITGQTYMFNNNVFNLTAINPDGSGLQLFSTYYRELSGNHCYGGAFDQNGDFIGNWFPIEHLTESSGFGGLKKYYRGATKKPEPLVGITSYGTLDYYVADPPSYGVFVGSYATAPFVMENGDILFSIAEDPSQDYGLYYMDSTGANIQQLLDIPGQVELNAQVLKPRPIPPIIPDQYLSVAELLPPLGENDLKAEGTFTFDCRNVFFNAPVDVPIISAPAVGEVGSVRFFAAPLRDQQYGSIEALDYPILYNELTVDEFGRVLETDAPAHVPLFEQARTPDSLGYTIPHTGGGILNGAAHVMGMNYGRPGQEVKCVGCHAGHSLIPVPSTASELLFTNLAPGAEITASTAHVDPGYAIDRRNYNTSNHWFSATGANPNEQWLKMSWKVPIWANQITLHGLPPSYGVNIHQCQITLFSDTGFVDSVWEQIINETLSSEGTTIPLSSPLKIQSMELRFLDCEGGVLNWPCAAIGDVEVIASPIHPDRFEEISDCEGIAYGTAMIDTCGQCLQANDPNFNDCLTNVADYITLHSCYISPNPAKNVLTLHFPAAEMKSLEIDIYTLTGEHLFSRKAQSSPLNLSIDHLPEGLYFVRLKHAGKSKALRLVKI